MTESLPPLEPDSNQAVEAIYNFAAVQMRSGANPAAIEKSLVDRGLDAESAAIVVRNLSEARSNALQQAARKNMVHGLLWCVGGIVVTAVTYQMAAGGGGKYVV